MKKQKEFVTTLNTYVLIAVEKECIEMLVTAGKETRRYLWKNVQVVMEAANVNGVEEGKRIKMAPHARCAWEPENATKKHPLVIVATTGK